jgi:hypothetical protein
MLPGGVVLVAILRTVGSVLEMLGFRERDLMSALFGGRAHHLYQLRAKGRRRMRESRAAESAEYPWLLRGGRQIYLYTGASMETRTT